VGKEGNRLEEVGTGEVIDPDEVLTNYGDDGWQQLVVPIGRLMGIRRLARETGLDRSQLIEVFRARSLSRPATKELLTGTIATWAAANLGCGLSPCLQGANAVMAAYLAAARGKHDDAR
jgi:hypothetical protein